MKRVSIITSFLALFVLNLNMAFSQDLNSDIIRRVNAASLELDKAEEQIKTGKTELAPYHLKGAQKEYDNIFNYYKGSFDPNHPILIKLKKRMERIGDELNVEKASSTKVEAKTAELSVNIRRHIDAADRQLVWVNQSAAKGEKDPNALETAKTEYANIFNYYKGSFDPNHPDIIALKKRIDAAEQAMNRGFAKKNTTAPLESNFRAVEDMPKKMGEDLISIAGALRSLENRLDTASKSNFPDSYVYGVNHDFNIALDKFNRFNETYKGQLNPNHVAYRQVETRINNDREAVSALERRAKASK